MFNKVIFAARLSELIKTHSITAKALADSLGVSKQAINQLEKEISAPSTNNLIAIAEYFGVSIDYLVGRTDNPEVND